jgi:hypothetical protein
MLPVLTLKATNLLKDLKGIPKECTAGGLCMPTPSQAQENLMSWPLFYLPF